MSALLTPKSASPTVGTGLALLTLIAVALLWATNARPISGYVVSALSPFLFTGVTLTHAEHVTGVVRDHALLAYVASALLMSLELSGQDANGVVLDALVLLGYGAVYASAAILTAQNFDQPTVLMAITLTTFTSLFAVNLIASAA